VNNIYAQIHNPNMVEYISHDETNQHIKDVLCPILV